MAGIGHSIRALHLEKAMRHVLDRRFSFGCLHLATPYALWSAAQDSPVLDRATPLCCN
jgi:hypothetical protein